MTDRMMQPAVEAVRSESIDGMIPIKNSHGARRIARQVLNGRMPTAYETFDAKVARKRGSFSFRIAEPEATSPRSTRHRLHNANRPRRPDAGPRYVSKTGSVVIEIIEVTTNAARNTGLKVGQLVRLHIRETGRGHKLHLTYQPPRAPSYQLLPAY